MRLAALALFALVGCRTPAGGELQSGIYRVTVSVGSDECETAPPTRVAGETTMAVAAAGESLGLPWGTSEGRPTWVRVDVLMRAGSYQASVCGATRSWTFRRGDPDESGGFDVQLDEAWTDTRGAEPTCSDPLPAPTHDCRRSETLRYDFLEACPAEGPIVVNLDGSLQCGAR